MAAAFSAYQRYWGQFLLTVTKKEIKARYKHTALGFLWTIINPLMQMAVIGTVFQFFVPVQVENYFLFLFTGLLAWDFFSGTLMGVTPIYVHERFLLKKAVFPREVIFLARILANAFHLLIAVSLFWLISLLWLGQPMSWSILWLPLALVWVVGLAAGLSAITASLNVPFRDVDFMVRAVLPLWLYATPIMYTIQLLPAAWHWIFYFNPMVGVAELFRFSLLNIPPANPQLLAVNGILTLVLCLIGWGIFRKLSPSFSDWL